MSLLIQTENKADLLDIVIMVILYAEINCGDPGTPTNGDTMGTLVRAGTSNDLALDTTLGAIVNHTCDEGFEIQGAMERECLPSGEWSEPLPSCIGKVKNLLLHGHDIYLVRVADCGNPGIPENGNTSVTVTTAGALVNHTCNTGFILRGAAQRECLPNGNWSEPLPVCVGKMLRLYHISACIIYSQLIAGES